MESGNDNIDLIVGSDAGPTEGVVHFDESLELLTNALNMKSLIFEKKLKQRLTHIHYGFHLVDNTKAKIVDRNGKEIMTTDWCMLGSYAVDPTNQSICWTWPWTNQQIKGHSSESEIRTFLQTLPDSQEFIRKDIIESRDRTIISFIFALLADGMNFDHIYALSNNGKYHAFGFRNINWATETFESENHINQLAVKNLKDEIAELVEQETAEFKAKIVDLARRFGVLLDTALAKSV